MEVPTQPQKAISHYLSKSYRENVLNRIKRPIIYTVFLEPIKLRSPYERATCIHKSCLGEEAVAAAVMSCRSVMLNLSTSKRTRGVEQGKDKT
jgi:hypothetical protein